MFIYRHKWLIPFLDRFGFFIYRLGYIHMHVCVCELFKSYQWKCSTWVNEVFVQDVLRDPVLHRVICKLAMVIRFLHMCSQEADFSHLEPILRLLNLQLHTTAAL
jgi:hypothetical protein